MKPRTGSSQFQKQGQDERARDCSLRLNTDRVVELGEEMVIAMRRLRRSLDECGRCRFVDDCAIKREFNAQVDTAIQEVNEEWGMV